MKAWTAAVSAVAVESRNTSSWWFEYLIVMVSLLTGHTEFTAVAL
jgi:hypothetical protein